MNESSTTNTKSMNQKLADREDQLRSDLQGITPVLKDSLRIRDRLPSIVALLTSASRSLDAYDLARSFRRIGIEADIPEEEVELVLRICRALSPDGEITGSRFFHLHEFDETSDRWITAEIALAVLDYAEIAPRQFAKLLSRYSDFTILYDNCPSLAQGIVKVAKDFEISGRLDCVAWLDENCRKLNICCGETLIALEQTFPEIFEEALDDEKSVASATVESGSDDKDKLRRWCNLLSECFRMTSEMQRNIGKVVAGRDFLDLSLKKHCLMYAASLGNEVLVSK